MNKLPVIITVSLATAVFTPLLAEERNNTAAESKTDVDSEQAAEDPVAPAEDLVAEAMARRAAKKRAREETERKIQEESEARLKTSRESMVSKLIDEMVDIPARNFQMGRTEVTQAQWEAVMGANPSTFTDPTHPVENVSWLMAQQFIEIINASETARNTHIVFRLPTAEEWEYACRAGSNGQFGLLADDREGTIREMGWYMGNTSDREMTRPVAQKQPNAWGLYDMHGNVEEWTSTGSADLYILAGGCYGSFDYNCAFPKCMHGRTARNKSARWVGFRLCAEKGL